MKIKHLFLKKRFIFEQKITDPPICNNQTSRDFSICSYSNGQISKELFEFLQKNIGKRKLLKRLECPNVLLFIANNVKTGNPAGYYWALFSHGDEFMHDSFIIPRGSALVFNAYVPGDFRKRGVYSILISFCHQYLFLNNQCNSIYTIVEETNFASLGANKKAGLLIQKTNYLIKFFGKNIFSLVRNGGWKIYFLLHKPHTIA